MTGCCSILFMLHRLLIMVNNYPYKNNVWVNCCLTNLDIIKTYSNIRQCDTQLKILHNKSINVLLCLKI